MTSKYLSSILLLSSLFIGGCDLGCKRDENTVLVGTVLGVIEGPYIASNPVIGNGIGQVIDTKSYPEAAEAFEDAKRVALGKKVYWQNAATEEWGSFCPIRDTTSDRGEYCREFATTTYLDKQKVQSKGKACRRRDGTWYMA